MKNKATCIHESWSSIASIQLFDWNILPVFFLIALPQIKQVSRMISRSISLIRKQGGSSILQSLEGVTIRITHSHDLWYLAKPTRQRKVSAFLGSSGYLSMMIRALGVRVIFPFLSSVEQPVSRIVSIDLCFIRRSSTPFGKAES